MRFVRTMIGPGLWFFNDCLRVYWGSSWSVWKWRHKVIVLGRLSIHWGIN